LTHGFATDGQGRKMSKSLGNTVVPQEVTDKLGAEIVRLWVASTDYSGDLNIDDKILARVVDTYRRVRNTLKFLLANTSDFDIAKDAVPLADMLEVDRYALSRTAQLQADIVGNYNAERGVFEGGHFGVYEFHPVWPNYKFFARKTWVLSIWTCSKTGSTPPKPARTPDAAHKPRCGTSPKPCCAGWRRFSASPQKKFGMSWGWAQLSSPAPICSWLHLTQPCWVNGRAS
jgi:hypothetical protein